MVTVYFHRTTHLPMRQIFIRRDPETKERMEEMTIFNSSGTRRGDVAVEYCAVSQRRQDLRDVLGEREFNPKLDPNLFLAPMNAKRLKPE